MCACPMPSAGQGRSGVCGSQMWTCASTITRRAGCALASSDACDAIARPAPAATVAVRISRRDNMDGLLLRWHSGDALASATSEDTRRFQLHLSGTGVSICNRNRIMTGLRFLLRVTLRRLDLVAEIYHIREPQKIPLVMSPDETRRLLAVANSLKARVLLSLAYGCGLRAGEVVRLKVKHIDSAQKIIRIEQSKGRKDRNVMLSPEMLELLRQWWKVRPSRYDAGIPMHSVP